MALRTPLRVLYLGLVLTGLALVFSACRKESPPSYDPALVLAPLAGEIAVPAHGEFLEAVEVLAQRSLDYRDQPGLITLDSLRNQLKSAHLAWKACEAFVFGGAHDQYLHNRIGKWPANPFLITQAIESTDSISPDFIAQRGATSVGLAALEYLLWEHSLDSTHSAFSQGTWSARRLEYMLGLCGHLKEKATALNAFWSPSGADFGQSWAHSTASGTDHPMGLLVNRMAALLEEVAKAKIGTPLGKFDWEVAQPDEVEAPYGGYSLELLRENIRVLHRIFRGPGGTGGVDDALDALEANYQGTALSAVINTAFEDLENAVAGIPGPLQTAVLSNPAAVEPAYARARELVVLLKSDMASALSVTITVSDNDGD